MHQVPDTEEPLGRLEAGLLLGIEPHLLHDPLLREPVEEEIRDIPLFPELPAVPLGLFVNAPPVLTHKEMLCVHHLSAGNAELFGVILPEADFFQHIVDDLCGCGFA